MKPIHLNLASRPYRDDRPYYAALVIGGVLLAFLLVNNVHTAFTYFSATKTTRQEINDLERSIASEQSKASAVDAKMKSVDLRSLKTKVTYVNSEIAIRAFSWSNLLDDLERVVPNDVRIITLTPSINKDGTTHLVLSCRGKEGQAMITFLNRLLSNPRFARPFPNTQSQSPLGGDDFTIEVDYRSGDMAMPQVSEAQP